MGIVEDMKRLTQEIVSSYQSRVSTIGMIIDDTHQLLEDFRARRTGMTNQLKETLAKEGSLRKKDFDHMMKDILSCQGEREQQVKGLLKTFFEEQKEIAEIVKKNLAAGEKIRIDDFRKMLQDMQARQKAREDEVSMTLKEFQKEYKEMAESLRSLLDKEEVIRIKDFREMLKNIRSRQIERTKEIGAKLDDFRKKQQDVASEWHRLTVVMPDRGAGSLKGVVTEEREEVTMV
jgi:uncharacterized protein YukE